MTLYHTSTVEIPVPDTVHSRPHLDFGRGFYLTPLREQAVRYGERFKRQGLETVLNVYELDDLRPGFTHKCLEAYDAEWLNFVSACRKGLAHEEFDLIEGGIADDQVFNTVDLFFSGIYSVDQALDRLRFHKPNHQFCITSQQLLDHHLHFSHSNLL